MHGERQRKVSDLLHGLKAEGGVVGDIDPAIMAQIVDVRTRFMDKMDWPMSGGIDHDSYDDEASTRHYYCLDNHDVLTTMRLTPRVGSEPQDVMSVAMLKANPEMHADAIKALHLLQEKCPQTYLYDLTRLFPKLGTSPEVIIAAMMSMFVPAMHDTSLLASQKGGSAMWVFSLKREMGVALRGMGIDYTRLTSGIATPGDNYATEFGYINPTEATRLAREASGSDVRYGLAKAAINLVDNRA